MAWFFGLCLPQLMAYVVGMPLISVVFLRRNRHKLLTSRIVMFRYGLIFNGYRKERYYWETVMAVRKASIVALGVFGSLTGVEGRLILD